MLLTEGTNLLSIDTFATLWFSTEANDKGCRQGSHFQAGPRHLSSRESARSLERRSHTAGVCRQGQDQRVETDAGLRDYR